MNPVPRIIARMIEMIATLLGASVLIWALLPLAPGDPALRTLQAMGNDSPRAAEVEALRAQFGLDRPLPMQYLAWLGRALGGDLGYSWQSGRPVAVELARRLPATALLAAVTLFLSIGFALAAALISAAFYRRWPDRAR